MATAAKKQLELPKEALITQMYDESEYEAGTCMFLIAIKEKHAFLSISTPVFGQGDMAVLKEHFDAKKPLSLKGLTTESKIGSDGKERLWLCLAE